MHKIESYTLFALFLHYSSDMDEIQTSKIKREYGEIHVQCETESYMRANWFKMLSSVHMPTFGIKSHIKSEIPPPFLQFKHLYRDFNPLNRKCNH